MRGIVAALLTVGITIPDLRPSSTETISSEGRPRAAGPARLARSQVVTLRPDPLPTVRLLDLAGRSVDPFAPTAPVIVVLFASTDCPISNRYAPEVRRLYERFAPRGVVFRLVYPNPDDGPARIRDHLQAYGYPTTALRDPRHDLVRAVGATVTPEAVVVDASRRVRYRGRIDDRYQDLGVDRLVPTTHDLAEAIEAVLDDRPVPVPVTRAVGCLLADFLPP